MLKKSLKKILCLTLTLVCQGVLLQAQRSLLNASYDSTREFYKAYNPLFVQYWKAKTGEDVTINQSHGGSGAQARSIINGLPADVATLALSLDIDLIAQKSHLLPGDWQNRLPQHSSPYSSTIVFLVRRGNPKHIQDWDDLVKPNITAVAPNPKTGGAPRWIYLAAWGYALKKKGGNESSARDFVTRLYKNIPVLDSGSRGSTTTFVEHQIGDVLITWENEARFAQSQYAPGDFEVVIPSVSILAEPSVAVVESVAARNGNLDLANAYLNYLYSPTAQLLAAKYYFRPRGKISQGLFPKLRMFTIDAVFGGWAAAQKKHFDDGGIYDQFYLK